MISELPEVKISNADRYCTAMVHALIESDVGFTELKIMNLRGHILSITSSLA